QKARERVLASLRDKKLRLLVATDVAARGIDIHQLSHVFLYEFPEEVESYIHRAGRTGRAGAVGTAISLVGHAEELKLKKASEQLKVPLLSRPLPSNEDVEKIVSERLTVMLEGELRSRDQVQRERMQRLIPLARSLGEEDDELQVIAMLLDDYYQKTLHAPPGWSAGDEPRKLPVQQSRPNRKQDSRRPRRRRR
ncbi:MAG: C-terminal helicase domain-containing protein, partial [Acidobacteriota bacterium]